MSDNRNISESVFQLSQDEGGGDSSVASDPLMEVDSGGDEGGGTDHPQETQPEPSLEATEDSSEVSETPDSDESEGEIKTEAKEGEEEAETKPLEPTFYETADGKKIAGATKIKKMVDGKIREVSIDEALAEYNGRFATKERFAESNKIKQRAEHRERQAKQAEYKQKQTSQRFLDAMTKGHSRDAVDVLCEFTGQNANEVWAQVAQAQKETIRQLSEMTEQEWKMYEKGQDAEYWQRVNEYKENQRVEQDVVTRKEAAQEKHSLSDEDLQRATNILLDMQKKGEYNRKLNLDDVVSTALDYRIYEQIDSTMKELVPDRVGDNQLYQQILDDTKKYGLSKEKWVKLIKEVTAAPSKKTVSSKPAPKATKNAYIKQETRKKTQQRRAYEEGDYLDVVDLDDLPTN